MTKVARSVPANVQHHFDELGRRLRGARIRRHMSLVETARQTAISRDTLHRLERGDASISIAALLNLLSVLALEDELDHVAAEIGPGEKQHVASLRARSARTSKRSEVPTFERQHLIDFAERNWAAVAELKTAGWLERRQRLGTDDSFRIADDLRRHVRTTRPDWPTDAARAADLVSHVVLGENLRRVRTI
jgi:transcriptional regulator with XRE-family HTH domain